MAQILINNNVLWTTSDITTGSFFSTTTTSTSGAGTKNGYSVTLDDTSIAGTGAVTLRGINITVTHSSLSASAHTLRGQAIVVRPNSAGSFSAGALTPLTVNTNILAGQIGNIIDIRQVNILTPTNASAVVVGTSTGLDILNQGMPSATTARGVFIRTISGSTNNFAIVVQGANNSGFGTTLPTEMIDVVGSIKVSVAYKIGALTGATGTFTTADGKTVTVVGGIITSIT